MRTSTTAGTEGPAQAGGPSAAVDGREGQVGRATRGHHDPLLASICHDLRAPLAAVTMGTKFVLQTTPEGEAGARARRVLEAVMRSCKQMERLVRDFGDLSVVEADAVTLRLGVHDAGELLALAAEAARPQAEAKTVNLEVSRPEAPLLIECDRDRVLRALAHVLDNALRFAPEGSTVSAIVRAEPGGGAAFRVTDTGPGIGEETMRNLYDRTWLAQRAERSTAGLGLAIVRGFVLAHGGRIDVASEPDEQTTFSLVFPKTAPTEAEHAAPV